MTIFISGSKFGAKRSIRVRQHDGARVSPWSSPLVVAGETFVRKFAAPAAFAADQWEVGETFASGEIAVTLFGLPANNGATISSVEYQLDGGAWTALPGVAPDTAYTIGGLTDGQTYAVAVRAVNSVGASAASATKTATPFDGSPAVWVPQLYDNAAIEESNSVAADLTAAPWTNNSVTVTPLASPDPYFPGPARIATTAAANWTTRNITFPALTSGEKMFASVIFRTGTAGETIRVLFRDPVAGQASSIVWQFGGFNTAQADIGAWSDVAISDIVGSDGVTYKRLTGTLTLNRDIASPSFRVGPNATAIGQYVDVYRAGATAGLALPSVVNAPSLADNALTATLTLDVGTATGAATPAVRWQSSPDNAAWSDIVGETGQTYSYSGETVGTYIRAGVVWTNSQGSIAEVFTAGFQIVATGGLDVTGLYNLDTMPVIEELMVVSPTRVVAQFDEAIYTFPRVNLATPKNTTTAESTAVQRFNNVSDTAWTSPTNTSAARQKSYEYPLQQDGSGSGGAKSVRRRVMLNLGSAMTNGQTVTVTANNGQSLSLTYGPGALSYMVHAPHHGFTPNAPKRALIGNWCGEAIALTSGQKWAILNADTDAEIAGWGFNDTKPATPTTAQLHPAGYSVDYNNAGEDEPILHKTDYVDFSSFTTPGRYKIAVENMGASRPFSIHASVTLPLARHVAMGLLACAHSTTRTALPASLRYPGSIDANLEARIHGRTAASWGNDGLRPGGNKLFEGNGTNAAALWPDSYTGTLTATTKTALKETDPVLLAHGVGTKHRGLQDAADTDFRPLHAQGCVQLFGTAITTASWIGSVDLGWDGAVAQPYSETIRGGAITGTVNLSQLDRIALHMADAYAELQFTDTIYDTDGTTPIWTPSDPVTDTSGNALGVADWYGAVRGGIDLGSYIGWSSTFATWAGDTSGFSPAGMAKRYALRPCPYGTYAAASMFGAAALRMKQLGDAKMQRYYTVRAERAWAWANKHEANTASWLTTCNGKEVWNPSWRSSTSGNGRFYYDKASADAALYMLTADAKYWTDAAKTGLNENASTWAVNGWTQTQLLLLACDAAGIINPGVAAAFTSKLAALKSTISADVASVWSAVNVSSSATLGDSLFFQWEGQTGANSYTNSFTNAVGMKTRFSPMLALWPTFDATQKDRYWRMIEGDVGFAAGRNPLGRASICSMGFDGPRAIAHSDWESMGLNVPPPGLVGFGIVRHGDFGAGGAYKINEASAIASFPAHHRVTHGPGLSSVSGEFNIVQGQVPMLCAVLALHHMEVS